ncbi:MAG: GntR family transcriptional regulator [Anaerolineaceae bacterium]|nr:GntR family transcriptional regulator [Anaerolineaceae bacterium]
MPIPKSDPPMDRSLLRDDVYFRIRDAIVDGTLAPNEQLRDQELAAWLGVSRTPVREALLRLAEVGLVIARPGRSTMVSPLNQRDVRDAREVVAAMHQLAVRSAVGSFTQADLDAMREANNRFRAAIEQGDVAAALRADDELHGIPVAVAANQAIAAVLDQYTPVLRRAEWLRFSSRGGRESLARHDELIRLCAAGDVEQAAAVAFDIWHTLPTIEDIDE